MKSYQKNKPIRDNKYLAWVRTQECIGIMCIGFVGDIIPAHQRILGHGGTGIKPPDNEALPLCFLCHSEEHKGAIRFWGKGTKAKTKDFVYTLCYFNYNKYLLEKQCKD